MEWIIQHWQTVAAFTVVAATIALFARRLLRPRKPGCGGGCDCQLKPKAPPAEAPPRPRLLP